MDVFQPKLIYLARRHPALDREAFRERWREHARLGMSRPRWVNIARYVHCDIVPPEAQLEPWRGDQDRVGMIWHRSPAHRRAHLADAGSRSEMEADEAATFSRPIVEDCLLAREQVRVAPPPDADWKLILFASTEAPAPVPTGAVGHVVDTPLPPENGESWGLPSARIEEFWFRSREEAEAAAAGLAGPDRLAVVAREVELYLRP
jgi:hypothetical protein